MAPRRRSAGTEAAMADEYQAPAANPLYRVLRVEDATMVGPTGGFQRSKRVYFVLSNGTTSFVEVPLASFNRQTVQNLIDQDVQQLLEVHNITGPDLGQPPS